MMDPETGEVLEGTDMSTNKGRLFKKDPAINVISKEEFEERIDKVFHLLWKTLSKSFGPYGAPTLIYNYPFSHVTKDGYTIMKNLSMDASETKVDQAIADMASDICGRLNYSVGDGTTSAVIATNSIYKRYMSIRESLNKKFVLPRDIIKMYEEIKTEVIKKMEDKIIPIQTNDLNELKQKIHDVVYISSNGDETITDYISELYGELGAPAISCMLAPDGITKKRLIEGYRYDLVLTDRLYINSDDNTADLDESDVIIFATKVTKDIYIKILKPLAEASRLRKRHLIIAAPSYDEVALQQVIRVDLNNEYRNRNDITMVLTVYHAINAHSRKLINDFACLMNTDVIDRPLCERILNELSIGNPIDTVFRIDDRDIEGLRCVATDGNQYVTYSKGLDELKDGFVSITDVFEPIENQIDLGYTKKCSLGLKVSQFTDLVYNENKYKMCLQDAKVDLEEKEKKYQKMGTFNVEVSQAQERLYSLYLKMGIIEVGADSELSQKMLKDAVDDAIKAAASAFKYGVVLGCNTNLIQIIFDMYKDCDPDSTRAILIRVLLEGFMDVYRTVLGNAFENCTWHVPSEDTQEKLLESIMEAKDQMLASLVSYCGDTDDVFTDEEALNNACKLCYSLYSGDISYHDVIILYSLLTNQVLDISKFRYSKDVINSSQTDVEILKATVDLITLLIVGNQMVVTQKHNF